jgi:putative tricarboxylic transport membrane protein
MNKTFDTIAGSIFLLLGLFFLAGSLGITHSSYGSVVGPNVFPFWLGALLVLLSAIVIVQAHKAGAPAKQKGGRNYARFGAILGATAAYVFLLEPLGYVIATFLYLVATFQVMERKRLLASVALSAFFACFIYYIYVSIFQGTLPPLPEWLGL